MRAPTPNTSAMTAALLDHATGGAAIRKPELYLHAEREAVARVHGCATWDEWDRRRSAETVEWWKQFVKETA